MALAPWGSPALAQEPLPATSGWETGGLELTRERLLELQERYQAVVESPAYSASLKEEAQRSLASIGDRLVRGDYRVGDRILVEVEGEEGIPDVLMVEPGPAVTFPVIGSISLEGVLRSELREHLTRELGRYIQDPVVRARSMMRISVQGAVGQPGFYVVPASALVGEVIMQAGGPAGNADLDDLRIERAGTVFLEGETLGTALVEGASLDQLNLRAGDQLVVGVSGPRPWVSNILRYGIVIASTLLFGIRIF